MTKEELQYLYEYIKGVVNEYLALKSEDEKRELLASTFAERHMQTITGQQFLPQKVFRSFLEEVEFVSDREYIDTKFDELWIKCLTEIAGRVITPEQYENIAKVGEKAKTLDDIKVDIPEGIATESYKGAIEKKVENVSTSVGEVYRSAMAIKKNTDGELKSIRVRMTGPGKPPTYEYIYIGLAPYDPFHMYEYTDDLGDHYLFTDADEDRLPQAGDEIYVRDAEGHYNVDSRWRLLEVVYNKLARQSDIPTEATQSEVDAMFENLPHNVNSNSGSQEDTPQAETYGYIDTDNKLVGQIDSDNFLIIG